MKCKCTNGNGEWLEAMRLFNAGGHASESITFDQFHHTLCHFLLVDLPEHETKRLFERYDADGSGEIDCHEFMAQLLPGAFFRTVTPLTLTPRRHKLTQSSEAVPFRSKTQFNTFKTRHYDPTGYFSNTQRPSPPKPTEERPPPPYERQCGTEWAHTHPERQPTLGRTGSPLGPRKYKTPLASEDDYFTETAFLRQHPGSNPQLRQARKGYFGHQ